MYVSMVQVESWHALSNHFVLQKKKQIRIVDVVNMFTIKSFADKFSKHICKYLCIVIFIS